MSDDRSSVVTERREAQRLQTELLGYARPGRDGNAREIRRLIDWLGTAVGGSAVLRDAGAEGGGPLVRDVAAGRPRSAAVVENGRGLRLLALGTTSPHPVLVVARSAPFDPESAELVGRAAMVLELLLRAAEADTAHRRAHEVTGHLQAAVWQFLMRGDVEPARRAVAGVRPGLLDTPWVTVLVLEAPAGERAATARECAALVAGQALVLPCPRHPGRVIVLAPFVTGPETGQVKHTVSAYAAGRRTVRLGSSNRHPPARTAEAYENACRNLAAARLSLCRPAGRSPRVQLPDLLEPDLAGLWAKHLLRPLYTVPLRERTRMMTTTCLGLRYTAVSSAKILGVSRNTVRARMARAAGILGIDLDDVRARTALHIALHFKDLEIAAGPGDADRLRLEQILAARGVREWAEHLVAPLAGDDRDLRRTLCVWIGENCGVEPTARRLGLHPQTVRDRLRSAETLLDKRLIAGGSDLYELIAAFTALDGRCPRARKNASGPLV
ncbi:helix-turn-helix domain-containing protein [Streptomyces tsukubensis]|uniref:helix-turn-helix domain-containing protein n=1 Tax=Streptomyces tsukubensis TaxID=83656 RepID=UPI0036C71626